MPTAESHLTVLEAVTMGQHTKPKPVPLAQALGPLDAPVAWTGLPWCPGEMKARRAHAKTTQTRSDPRPAGDV